jgi:hypothetical protein
MERDLEALLREGGYWRGYFASFSFLTDHCIFKKILASGIMPSEVPSFNPDFLHMLHCTSIYFLPWHRQRITHMGVVATKQNLNFLQVCALGVAVYKEQMTRHSIANTVIVTNRLIATVA